MAERLHGQLRRAPTDSAFRKRWRRGLAVLENASYLQQTSDYACCLASHVPVPQSPHISSVGNVTITASPSVHSATTPTIVPAGMAPCEVEQPRHEVMRAERPEWPASVSLQVQLLPLLIEGLVQDPEDGVVDEVWAATFLRLHVFVQ